MYRQINQKLFSVMLLVLLSAAPVWAQTATGIVSGTVKDATGAVIPGVEVSITNAATNLHWTGVSNDAGIFRITNVPPGRYRAEAALTGFKTARANFELDVAGHQTLNFTLEIGDIAEVVEVAGAVQKVSTEDSTLSSVVQERQVQDLPLNGRNVFQLAVLQPGVTQGLTDGIGGESGINASGNRVRGNNFSLDGTSNNDPITGGSVALTPNLDTVQEFRIQNNNFSAEYGRNNGAIINVITKSGTNDVHGTAFWYHRNDELDAREVFDEGPPPPLRQHQAGFSLGGPIRRDRTFFFGAFEGFHVFSGETSLGTFETPEFRNLVNQQFPGTLPAFLLKTYPGPTPTQDVRDVGSPSSGIGSPGPRDGIPDAGRAAFFSPSLFKRYQYNVRVDHELSEKNRLFSRVTWETQESPADNIRNDELGSDFDGANTHGLISDTYIFSPSLVSEFRFGYSRTRSDFDVPRFDITDFNIFNFVGGDGIAGFGAYGGIPQFFTAEEYHLVDVVSINAGDHGVKTGFEYRWNQDDSDFQFLTRGYVGFLGMFDFAANLPYEISTRIQPRQGALSLVGTPHNFRQSEVGFFIQDDWKVAERLTLNLGLRYDNYGQISDTQEGRLSNLILGDGRDVFERVMNGRVDAVDSDGIFKRDNNNFAPRIGFAWDLFGDGKTSLRSGFGVAYDRLFLNVTGNIRFNPPTSANLGLYPFRLFRALGASPTAVSRWLGDNLGIPFKIPSGVSGRGFNAGGGPLLGITLPGSTSEAEIGGAISLRAPDASLRTSYSMNWFFGIQRELPWDMLFEANYVGNGGRKLGFIERYNRFNGDRFGLPNPYNGAGANSRAIEGLTPFFTSENLRTNNVNSSYHGGNVSLQKRFSQGLSFQAAYTFGKVIDFASDNFGSNASSIFSPNPGRFDLEKGKAGFDIPQRFVANFIYEIPFLKQQQGVLGQVLGGWQIQGIVAVQDGSPYTPQAFSSAHDYNGDSQNNERPDAPASVDQFNDLSVQQYIAGVFGATGADARAKFNTSGLPGDCDGDGRVGGPTGAATFNGKSCIGIGNMGRSLFRGPGFASTDFSLFKHFRIPWFTQEDARLQFRAEFFNFFNRVNLGNVSRSFTSGLFGRSTAALDAREIQFALKLIF